MSFGRHRIFKYNGYWYYICGMCTGSRPSRSWQQSRDLLQTHVDVHEHLQHSIEMLKAL